MNNDEKIQEIEQIMSDYREKLAVLRKKQFLVIENLLDKTDAKKIAKIKEEIEKL